MSAEPMQVTGKCLCGGVSFTATATTPHVGACHCKMCRIWSGGVVLALEDANDLKVSGEDNMVVYKSSDWGERCFCKTCGSNLFWRSPQLGHTAIMAGALSDESQLKMTSEIFIDSKPAYYDFANNTERLSEAEVLAKFAGEESKD